MKRYILSLMALLFSVVSFSQEIIEYKGDTVVTISQKDLNTINTMFVKYDWAMNENKLYKSIIKNDSILIQSKDSIITSSRLISYERERYWTDYSISLQRIIEREKKKSKITNTVLGSAVVILGVIVLCK